MELLRAFGCVRLVYNRALEARTAAWFGEQRRVNYVQTSALLTEWKKTDGLAFLNEVSSVPLQQSLRHLQSAFTAFWEKRARYPRFKSRKRGKASAEYTRSAFRWRDGRSRDPAGRWHVSILVETTIAHAPPTGRVVGVDAGIRWFPSSKTCSDCGHLLDLLQLRVREWACPGCGASHDRDVNAARNILAAGQAVTACGAGVRPTRR